MRDSGFKIAIRDDDCSYWTTPDELESVYGKYWKKGIKVSFSVVPYAYNLINNDNRSEMYHIDNPKYIYENESLVKYLKDKIKMGQVEIMQHGYDHSYYVRYNGKSYFLDKKTRENINVKDEVIYLPECIHKNDEIIKRDIIKGKEILEDTFDTEIKIFVPPSNAIRAYVVEEVASLGMNISGTIMPAFNRTKTIQSYRIYINKLLWHIRNKKISYPFIMNYETHKELAGTTVSPSMNKQNFWEKYDYCKHNELPFLLATHYWEINKTEEMHDYFDYILEKIVNEGDKITFMSELLR